MALKPSAAILVVSDRVSAGAAEDLSGPALERALEALGYEVKETATVPDDAGRVAEALRRLAASASLVLTTGGTGVSARDRTPEATLSVAEITVPGLAEEMRRAGREKTPNAILSRGVAAVVGSALVLNLPGSPAGAVESLDAVAAVLPHALRLLAGDTGH